MSIHIPAVPGSDAGVGACADAVTTPAMDRVAVDLVGLRERVIAAGGQVSVAELRQLLAAGPSGLAAAVLEVVDPARVVPDRGDLADPAAVPASVFERVAREAGDQGRLLLVILWERHAAWVNAQTLAAIHGFASAAMDPSGREPGPAARFDTDRSTVVSEIATACAVAGSTADGRLGQAELLNPHGLLAPTHAALARGWITPWVARALVDAVWDMTPEQIRAVQGIVLPRLTRFINPATGEGTLTLIKSARERIARAVHRVDPDRARRKREQAIQDRGVSFREFPDTGMVRISAYLPALEGTCLWHVIQGLADHEQARDRHALEQTGEGAVRTLPNCRADVLTQALTDLDQRVKNGEAVPQASFQTSTQPSTQIYAQASTQIYAQASQQTGPQIRPRATIAVLVDLPTLLALRAGASELPGHGPLDPDLVKALAADAAWQRWIHAPMQGELLDTGLDAGKDTYTPSPAMRAFIHARDPQCTFPGCNQPSRRCQLDHITPWPAGRTTRDNLHPLCIHHHNLKTHAHWQAQRDPTTGTTTWTSPHGLTITNPHPYNDIGLSDEEPHDTD